MPDAVSIVPYVISLRAEGMVGPGARDRDERGVDCIDCHKGIAHKLPGLTGIVNTLRYGLGRPAS